MQGARFAFGPFVLDSGAGTLLRNDDPVAVGHRGLKLLAALVGRPGEILGKAELMDAAWPGTAVEEGNLTVQIAQLRKLLGPAEGGGEWISTVPRVGYRFTGAIAPHRMDRVPRPLPDRPSIAVLPFVNVSSDPQQESFSDGLTEDLITDLSRMPGLFVIARNSVFAYKGRAADVRAIAEDLGVRYLLQGSARHAGGRVRINAQLVDALHGDHLWADRFDRSLDDIFAVQDEVAGKIVEALLGRLRAPPPRNRPKSLEAYDLCVRARKLIDDSPQTAREAHLMLTRAVALDPHYAEAYRWLAMNHWMGWVHWGEPEEPARGLALALAEKAVAIDPNDAGCRWVLANLLAYERRFDEADAEFDRAIALDPNEADTFATRSDILVLAGRVEEGLEQIRKAFRLNPYPASWYYLTLGQAQYAAGAYEAAVETLIRDETYRTGSRRFLAASLAQLGRLDEARAEVALFLIANPHFSTSQWAETEPFRDAATRAHFVEGYRRAGLPA
ncbi:MULTISPECIES: winged helix-turn-helix domain-containing tetratricopeptide repeat protein [unclassified Shinella]|jgi:TolB-like protein|uniref:winged helix-turn-helix domain-containing tetratricopeptide repeat protein n=1 Tax=unclassified Shinella TaxID=2643062 RepID=UPI00234FA34E|nr:MULTISPECIES: winged helix-turn-helix domain-containing tetratricopeptide repeat protein [unclassified Shinella]MCO5151511.1 winged helix-turn-helix domain-containing tetratricopeptide repeat protein [Shinella sp.]MDC7266118.1 winged helix-turn-helix domain-containing tetratricopeptide repeat protein [Shinella sp. HY16]MDC7273015.1 winged helix-turn-helix domain-containing tetratricopeptide repeat protein [Shinella sp. YZ44]